MQLRRYAIIIGLTGIVTVTLKSLPQRSQLSAAPAIGDIAAPPLSSSTPNRADEMAWQLFARINRPAPAQKGFNDVIWETWADDDYQFPAKPDPVKAPTWPPPRAGKSLRSNSPTIETALRNRRLLPTKIAPIPHIPASGIQEEVRRNKAVFDYIVANKLWYLEGISAFARKGQDVQTPQQSIMVKAHWKQIEEKDKPRYHWNVDGNGKLFGLIALHISSKDFPNWLWATFEHLDNPNRGKDLGCHDSFGVVPANTCDGQVSSAIQELFAKEGLKDEFFNYRLDGSQIDFLDGTGRPTVLGNSEIEGRIGGDQDRNSSCITCHGRARVAMDGSQIFTDANFVLGAPPPSLYYDSSGAKVNIQLDFVWGFALASPAAAPPTP